MKTLLKVAGPVLMLIGLLLVAKFPHSAQDGPEAELWRVLTALDPSGPHWREGIALMGGGTLCLFLQVFLKDAPRPPQA